MGFLPLPIASFFSLGTERSIDTITGYITISENTVDSLEITQQPVQQGASIADHSFKKPVSFSAQIQAKPGLGTALLDTFSGDALSELYEKFLDLQDAREPFTITTPKRVYESMLFKTLSLTTDKRTENVLAISATFEEVILVSVTTTLVPRIKQKNPGLTGGIANVGKKSALLSLKQGIGGLL